MIPTIPTRLDAYVQCGCGGTAQIATVAPVAGDPGHMRHLYTCLECGREMSFDVAKKANKKATEQGAPSSS
jgi:hypothetical protein